MHASKNEVKPRKDMTGAAEASVALDLAGIATTGGSPFFAAFAKGGRLLSVSAVGVREA
jgi:hypothetical protein